MLQQVIWQGVEEDQLNDCQSGPGTQSSFSTNMYNNKKKISFHCLICIVIVYLTHIDLLLSLSSSIILPEPMRALRGLTATDTQPRQLSLQWETLAFNLTRCHTYSVSLCYRYTTAGGGGGHNTTVRECLAVEHNASRFTLRDLPPYHSIYVRLSLANPEGKKESREVTFQTEEDSKSQEEVAEKDCMETESMISFNYL